MYKPKQDAIEEMRGIFFPLAEGESIAEVDLEAWAKEIARKASYWGAIINVSREVYDKGKPISPLAKRENNKHE